GKARGQGRESAHRAGPRTLPHNRTDRSRRDDASRVADDSIAARRSNRLDPLRTFPDDRWLAHLAMAERQAFVTHACADSRGGGPQGSVDRDEKVLPDCESP